MRCPPAIGAAIWMTCILTLGAEVAIVAGSGNSFSVDAASVTPLDTTGAGDTFVGVLAAGLDGGMDLRTSATRASLAASLASTVTAAQTSIPTASVIDANSHLLPKIKTLS